MHTHKLFQIKIGFIFFLLVCLVVLINFLIPLRYHFILDDWMNIWYVWSGDINGYKTQFDYHPANYLIFKPFVTLFKDNPLPYNYLGLIAKILASFAVGFLAMAITQQKKAFFVATLLYASYFGSQESYVFTTARNNVVNLILTSLTISFYIYGCVRKKMVLTFFSLIFLFLSFLADPIRMIFLPILLIGYEIANSFSRVISKKLTLFRLLSITVVSLLSLLLTEFGWYLFFPGGSIEQGHLIKSLASTEDYQVFFLSIGDLVTSYFRISYHGHELFGFILQKSTEIGVTVSLFLVIFGLGMVFKAKKPTYGVFIPGGILLSLLINWVAFPYIISYAQHRYQIISSAFFIVLITSFLVQKFFRKFFLLGLALIVMFNLFRTYTINRDWDSIRNYAKVQGLIDKQLSMIPVQVKPQMFVLLGQERIVSEQLNWSFAGTVPYSFRYNLKNRADIPTFVASLDQVYQIYCNDLGQKPVISEWIPQTEALDLSKIYGFKIMDENLINYTDPVRMDILGHASCAEKKAGDILVPGIKLVSYIESSQLIKNHTKGLYLKWRIDKSKFQMVRFSYPEALDVDGKYFTAIDLDKLNQQDFNQILFFTDQLKNLDIQIDYCEQKACLNPKQIKYQIPL